jgi:hypothetical protein
VIYPNRSAAAGVRVLAFAFYRYFDLHSSLAQSGGHIKVTRLCLPTLCISFLPAKQTFDQLITKFQVFYRSRRFIFVFGCARRWHISRVWRIHTRSSHLISLRVILLSFHLRLGFSSDLFPLCFSTISPVRSSPASTCLLLALCISLFLVWLY